MQSSGQPPGGRTVRIRTPRVNQTDRVRGTAGPRPGEAPGNNEVLLAVLAGTFAAMLAAMRRTLCLVVLLGCYGSASADAPASAADVAHAEMAAALAAQADLEPTPLVLPVTAAAPRHASASSAVKRGIAPRGPGDAAGSAANQVSQRAQAQGAAQALAHQAQAAAAAAAGQAQSKAAKERASHPHPR